MKFSKCLSLAALFTFVCTTVFSQPKDAEPPLSCYKTSAGIGIRNPEKLAKKLTEKLESDSEKVCAIYGWITAHIKYDINKAATYDFKRNGPEYVLKKRKAICLGYSDLFNTLCKYADLTSSGVEGYVKSGDYDQGDSFFISRHIWNAVLIEGEWRLFDVTWDAGYIQWIRRTWRGKLILIFTFGKMKYYYFKPKFVQYPMSNYFMKTGNYFSYDHLPSLPMWQLMDSTITIKQWEKDSAFFWGKKKPEKYEKVTAEIDQQRKEFAIKNDMDQHIDLGPISQNYNERNYLDLANSKTMLANKLSIGFNEDGDSIIENPICRTIAKTADSAVNYYNIALVKLGEQKVMQMNQAKLKKKYCNQHNKYLIKAAKTAGKMVKRSMVDLNTSVKAINAYELNSYASLRAASKFNFQKAPWSQSKSDKEKKVKVMDSVIKVYDDSIKSLRTTMEKLQLVILRTWDDNEINSEDFYENNQWARDIIVNNTYARMFEGWDDLDYLYRRSQDSLIKYKSHYDSVLLLKGIPLADSLALLFKQFTKYSKLTHKLFTKKQKAIIKIKSYSSQDNEVEERYKDFMDEYRDFRKEELEWTKQWQKPVDKMALNYKESYKLIMGTQIGVLKYEIKLENKFQKGRKEHINKEIKGLKAAVKNNSKIAKTTKKAAIKHMKAVSKKK